MRHIKKRGALEHVDEADSLRFLDLNYMGALVVLRLLCPIMRQARAGHITNISSIGGRVGEPFNGVYCGAKLAVKGLAEAMASYIMPSFGIYFSAVELGGIMTEYTNTVLDQIAETHHCVHLPL